MEIRQMNGLRIYVRAEDHVSVGSRLSAMDSYWRPAVFYSRRADGPYYRWRYEGMPGQWHSSRMHAADMSPRDLYVAPWKGVPASLKLSLSEHYLE